MACRAGGAGRRVGRLRRRQFDGLGESPRRVPDAQPAVTEPTRPPDRGVGTAADDDGNGGGRCRCDDRVLEVEELAVEGDRLAGQELTHDGEAFVHPQAPGCRVDAADRDFVAILATDADAEDKPSGSDPVDVGELPGHMDGMAQRQQVHAGMDRQRRMEHRKRGGLQEPVEPNARKEAHMIPAANMVDARVTQLPQEHPGSLGALLEHSERRKHANPGRRVPGSRVLRCGGWADRRTAAHVVFPHSSCALRRCRARGSMPSLDATIARLLRTIG